MITKIVNGVEYDVDVNSPGDLYFNKDFALRVPNGGITDILYEIYKESSAYAPLSLMWEITSNCNFRCQFCYTKSSHDNTKITRFRDLKADLQYLIDNGLMTCTITGGECLTHPDFFDIYRFLKENGVIVTVLSNLSLLTNEHIELFKELPPFKVDVTIYAIDDSIMKEMTAQNCYSSELILSNILLLKNNDINVTCKTPVTNINISDIQMINDWCDKNNITYFSSPEIFENYDGQPMNSFAISEDEVNKDVIRITKEKLGTDYGEHGKKTSFDCKGGEYGLFISHDYILRPCLPFYDILEANFDISKFGMGHALNKMIMFIKKYKGNDLAFCSGCKAIALCKECIITQLRNKENLYDYMNGQCQNAQRLFNKY